MPKTKPIKLERNLSLRLLSPGKWEMRIQKPDKKKILYGTLAEVTAEATAIYKSATSGTTNNPTVSEAISMALAGGKANEETLERYIREANRFQAWLKTAYPGLEYWRDMRKFVMQAYINKLEAEGRARDSVRLAIFPIRTTSLYWSDNYHDDFHHHARKLTLKKTAKQPTKALTFDQLESVLTWLKDNRPEMYPLAALAGYMGMRLREPSGILIRDVDLQAGIIHLRSNPVRKLKNELHAPRTIPMTEAAREAIEHYLKTAPVQSIQPDEPLFLNQRGSPWTAKYLGIRARDVKDAMNRKLSLPEWFVLRKLRATFHTITIKAGAREGYADAYQGRRPQTIGMKHYTEIDTADYEREVVSVFNRLSGKVVIDTTTNTTIQPYIENK